MFSRLIFLRGDVQKLCHFLLGYSVMSSIWGISFSRKSSQKLKGTIGGGEEWGNICHKLYFFYTGKRYVRFRGKRRRVRIRRKYFFGRKRIRRFRRRIRILVRRKYRKIKRFGRRWRVRIKRRWCGLRRFGRKWYLRRKRKWRKIKRVKLRLKYRKKRIRIRRRRKKWYVRRRKRWRRVRRRVRCSIRVRGRRVRVRLIGRRRVRITKNGRTRRIRFRRELANKSNDESCLVQWGIHVFNKKKISKYIKRKPQNVSTECNTKE